MKTFHLPDLGEGLAEAEIVRWHVSTGDHINADDPMLAVETAKAIVEVPSPFSGVIKATYGNPGDTVATGGLLVEFEADAAPETTSAAAAPHVARSTSVNTMAPTARAADGPSADSGTVVGNMPTSDEDFVDTYGTNISSGAGANGNTASLDRVRAVPAARALAKRLGIDLANVRGTGRGALVTIDDVLHMTTAGSSSVGRGGSQTTVGSMAQDMVQTPPRGTAATSDGAPHTPGGHAAAQATPQQAAGALRSDTLGGVHPTHLPSNAPAHEGERLRGPRRAMAHSMAVSRDNVMGCTLFDDADLHSWLHPENHQQGDEPQKPDITTRVLRAIAEGCAAEPALNSWFDGEALTRRVLTQIDVAIAVDTPEGLIVPVVRNIAVRPVAELRREVDRLKRDTRERTVKPEDLRDFTFMLSNFGMIAGRYATPVVVPPAVAILGCGRLSHDVIATQSGSSSAKTSSQHYPSGNIEAHLRMPLSLTFDHRCVTGGEAARFLAAVIRDLQKGN